MSPLAQFLREYLFEGRAVLRGPPEGRAGADKEAVDLLRRAFEAHRLAVAGPAIGFDLKTAPWTSRANPASSTC